MRAEVVNVAVVNGAKLTRLEIVITPFEFTVLQFHVAPDADDVGTVILHRAGQVATLPSSAPCLIPRWRGVFDGSAMIALARWVRGMDCRAIFGDAGGTGVLQQSAGYEGT